MRAWEIDTSNRQHVRLFLDFPFRLYQRCPQWVPPMAADARLRLDRRRYPYYRHSDAAFFLATAKGTPLGRIAVLDHRRSTVLARTVSTAANARADENPDATGALFYYFDAVEDPAVAQALFDAAEVWSRHRGRTYLTGPVGFAAGDPIGLLVQGFEHRAAMGITYNHSYYARLVEGSGFQKEFDLISYHATQHTSFPNRIHTIADRVKHRWGLQVVNFRSKRELRALVPKIKKVYNETLGTMERNTPLTEEEIDAVADRMISVAEPELIKVVMRGDELVGFLFAFPDLSAAIQRCKGRLWPIGWFWLLREYQRTRWVNLNGMAVVPKFQGLGATVVLYSEMAKTLQTGRFTDGDLVQVRDNNPRMIRELEGLGVSAYKRHRVYRKQLQNAAEGLPEGSLAHIGDQEESPLG